MMEGRAATVDMTDNSRLSPYALGAAWVAAFSLLVYLAVLWPRLLVFALGFTNQTPLSALTVAMFLGALFLFATRPAVMRHYYGSSQLGIAVALFLALILCKYISAFGGQDPPGSVNVLNNTISYYMSFFIIGLAMFADPRNEENFPRILLIAGLVAAVLGIYEMLRQNALTVEFGWVFNFGAPQSFAGENLKANTYRGGLLRAKSTFMHPIVFGQFVAACLPLAFLINPEGKSKLWRWTMVFIALGLAILATNTRSPLVGAAVSFAVYGGLGILALRRSRTVIMLAIVIAALAMTIFLVFGEDVTSLISGRTAEEVSSSQARNLMFERAFFALDGSPIFGYGEGRSVFVAGIFTAAGVLTIDSLYISYLIDNGYLGVGVFAIFFSYVFLVGIRGLRRLVDEQKKRRLRAVMAFVASLLFGQSILSLQDNLVFAYLGAAYIIAGAASARSSYPAQSASIPSTDTQVQL
jgi:O-antigen ligase